MSLDCASVSGKHFYHGSGCSDIAHSHVGAWLSFLVGFTGDILLWTLMLWLLETQLNTMSRSVCQGKRFIPCLRVHHFTFTNTAGFLLFSVFFLLSLMLLFTVLEILGFKNMTINVSQTSNTRIHSSVHSGDS